MRNRLLPLTAAVALLLTAAACSDDDTAEVSSDPAVSATAESDSTMSDDTMSESSEPESTDGDTSSTSEPTGDIVLGSAGSWLPEDLEDLEVNESNAIPVIDASLADERVTPDNWVWDWWPVRDRDGEVADFDGTSIAIALSAPSDVLPGKRHDIATHRYLLSDDGGRTWTDGGDLFPDDEELLGTRQWAGSAMFDDETDTLYAFYTATGDEADGQNQPETTTTDSTDAATTTEPTDESDESDEQTAPSGGTVGDDISYRQRLAVASATLTVTDGEPEFEDWSEHAVLLTGDDTDLYASTEATEGGAGEIDAFRDPWFFLDEETGEEYILFTATMPQAECDGDGVVGVARATDDSLLEWEMLPPMLDGHCVNSELERPQMMVEDGMNYLLFTTHSHTFQDDASGPEGMYGFVSDSFLDGTYEPLNGTGLVLANPEEAPYQSYSWMTLSNGVVTSFFQFFDIDGDVEVSYIGEQSPEFQMEHFGGTFAPSILVDFDGDRTEIVEELAPGQLVP